MNPILLFSRVVFTWGTGPIATATLVAASDPEPLVGYRFVVAAAVLLGWCSVRGLSLRFGARDHAFLALQGLLLCSLNEMLWWGSVARVEVSGLVPLALTLMTVMNSVLGALFLGLPIRRRVIGGGAIGIAGVTMVFWRELSAFDPSSAGLVGLGFALAGAVLASFGSIASARNQHAGIPVLAGTAISMVYGAISSLVVALALGRDFAVAWTPAFAGAFVWMTLATTAFGVTGYIALIGRLGPDRAAYAHVVVPVVALAVSTVFEGYLWTPLAAAGIVLALGGNLLVLKKTGGPGRGRPQRAGEP
jgi:drug/metabolite transporter (DMT)-like permease